MPSLHFGLRILDQNWGVLGVTKIFRIMQLITSCQFDIIHFDWLNFCHSDQNFGHSEHTHFLFVLIVHCRYIMCSYWSDMNTKLEA